MPRESTAVTATATQAQSAVDAYLKLALAEGFGEGPIAALLEPDVDPWAWLEQWVSLLATIWFSLRPTVWVKPVC